VSVGEDGRRLRRVGLLPASPLLVATPEESETGVEVEVARTSFFHLDVFKPVINSQIVEREEPYSIDQTPEARPNTGQTFQLPGRLGQTYSTLMGCRGRTRGAVAGTGGLQ
jgi:hypothetical protein